MYSPSDPDESENFRIYVIANMSLSPLKMFFISVKSTQARTVKWAKTEKCILYPTPTKPRKPKDKATAKMPLSLLKTLRYGAQRPWGSNFKGKNCYEYPNTKIYHSVIFQLFKLQ